MSTDFGGFFTPAEAADIVVKWAESYTDKKKIARDELEREFDKISRTTLTFLINAAFEKGYESF